MSSAMPMVVDGTSHVTGANSGKRKRESAYKKVQSAHCND